MNSAALPVSRMKLGEILVSAGLLSEDNLEKALAEQKEAGEKLGFILITKMYISEGQLIQALSKQLSVPWVSLTHLEITTELMKLVSPELVTKYGVVPVYIMSRRPGEKVLYVAMDDPTNDELLTKISGSSGMGVKPMIAAPSEIATAVRRYYRTRWDTGERLVDTLRSAIAAAARQVERTSQPEPAREPEREPAAEPAREPERVEERAEPEIEGAEEAFVLPESAAILEVDADEEKPGEQMIVLPKEAEVKEKLPPREEPRVPEEPPSKGAVTAEEEKAAAGDAGEKAAEEEAAEEEGEGEGPGEAEQPEPAPGSAVSFTFLDGTKLSFGAAGAALKAKAADEKQLMDRIRQLMKKDKSGRTASVAVTGIIEVLLKRGLITFDEIEHIMDRLEKR